MIQDPLYPAYNPATIGAAFDQAGWHKSFASEPNGGNCVEVNTATGFVGLRDTKLSNSPVLAFDNDEWNAFIIAVKAGQFDLPA